MLTKDIQVRKLMEEKSKNRKLGIAALRSGMDRKTARKYLAIGKLPSELRKPHDWRTRTDPFVDDWAEIETRLKDAPTLEAKTLFEDLHRRHPEKYEPGQLRTLQRRIKRWRATRGPEQEIFFTQQHVAGEAMQTDFTWGTKLSITLSGEPFDHMLCHAVLPYSNWEWVTVCQSESMLAIKRGVQSAVFRLGMVPRYHQTDNSTSATHDLPKDGRGFNEDYEAMIRHLGMEPRTIEVGKKEQNGDVEASNGAFKRKVEQHLLMRGSRDFSSEAEYEQWLQTIAEKGNDLRQTKLQEEMAAMRPLQVERLAEFDEEKARVGWGSTIRVRHNTYSVPSRLIGEECVVKVYENRLEVFYAGQEVLKTPRLLGRFGARIDYRHIIWSLVRKPNAFARYRYREELFPTVVFRRAYDALSEVKSGTAGDLEYLRILHLAASTMEREVEVALEILLEQKVLPTVEEVKALQARPKVEVPALATMQVELGDYDALLSSREGVA